MTGKTVKLTDLYTGAELMEETELLGLNVCGNDLDRTFLVGRMSAEDLADLNHGGESVFDLYDREATRKQKSLVRSKAKNFEESRIIVVSGTDLIDGFHHVIAARELGREVLFLDLAQEDPENDPEEPDL